MSLYIDKSVNAQIATPPAVATSTRQVVHVEEAARVLARPAARVAVFRPLYVGDLLCAIPAVRALKSHNRGLQLTLLGLPWSRFIVERFSSYFDGFIEVPPLAGLHDEPSSEQAAQGALDDIRERRFDLIIQMHGSGPRSNALVQSMGAALTAGFHPPGAPCEDGAYFPYPAGGTEVERNLALVAGLGVPSAGTHLEYPVRKNDRDELVGLGIGFHDYVCVHPGAKLPSRRWPAQRFAAVADRLSRRGFQVVITGSESETDIAASVASAMTRPSLDLAGRTSLGALGALVQGASLVVANDTSLSHIAAALRRPSVVIASGSDPARWAPEDRVLHRTLAQPLECRPCSYHECPMGHPCALAISVERVMEQAEALLISTRKGGTRQ